MKFSKPKKKNMFIFFGGIVLILVGTFSFRYYYAHKILHPTPLPSLPSQTSSDEYPHPQGDNPSAAVPKDNREVSVSEEKVKEAAEPNGTTVENEKSVEEKPKRRKLGKMGLLAAYQPALQLIDSDPGLAIEKMHDIAKELGDGDPELTEYFHLEGHALFNQPSEKDKSYLSVEDGVRYLELKEKLFGLNDAQEKELQEGRLGLKWNRDGGEVVQQIEPIIYVRQWMKENAPAEWELVNTRYFELIHEGLPASSLSEKMPTIRERVDKHYENFFKALELLPDNSVTLSTLYGNSHEEAETTLYSEQSKIQTAPPIPDVPPTHTWETTHEPSPLVDVPRADKQGAAEEVSQRLSATEHLLSAENETEFQKRLTGSLRELFPQERLTQALETLQKHGPVEGLKRIQESHPEIASEIEKRSRNQR